MKSPITTHILDTTNGVPASEVAVSLAILSPSPSASSTGGAVAPSWKTLGSSVTNSDGRCPDLLLLAKSDGSGPSVIPLVPGAVYKLAFDIEAYFKRKGLPCFFTAAEIQFRVSDPPAEHYHVPLLVSPFSYSTYRGS
ncbi:hypothetical protein DFJ73DRAFT_832820 [Zopfochytrium polystomum]|nr:hypothetical protein DFJ73DRAFT_832820 [Zopfochytrium polystomum]